MIARVHAIESRSRANGPGVRFVIWLQGCSLGCVGCFNPATHEVGGEPRAVEDLLAELAAMPADVGLTLSGGEPMQQPAAAAALLAGARGMGRSTLMFSGYAINELRNRARTEPDVALALASCDIIIDGRYRASERLAEGLRGSANQNINLLSDRYTMRDVENTPVAEVRISPDGEVVLTGVNPLKLRH